MGGSQEFVYDEDREYSDMDRGLVFLYLWTGGLQEHWPDEKSTQLGVLRLLTGWDETRATDAIEKGIANGMVQFHVDGEE